MAAESPLTWILVWVEAMKTVVRIVKRGVKQQPVAKEEARTTQHSPSDVVKTVKAWITESREQRSAASSPLWLQEARKEMRTKRALSSSLQMSAQTAGEVIS
ncbi:MAG: hypothetical protein C5B55_07360 [Blastocatellia bacterium]|nr:MAG: hypothetical protein C5B55_07360 [Blastocatellia bacterium]